MCRGLQHHVLQLPPPSLRKEQPGPWSFLGHLNSNPLTTLLDFKSHCCSPLPSALTTLAKELLSLLLDCWDSHPPAHPLPILTKFSNRFLCYYKCCFFLFLSSLLSLSLFLSFHYNLRITHNWYPASLIHFLQFSFHLGWSKRFSHNATNACSSHHMKNNEWVTLSWCNMPETWESCCSFYLET